MMEDRREAGYVITNGNPTGTERKTESKTENKMGNVNGSGIVMGTPADLEVSSIKDLRICSPEHTGWLKPYSYGNGYFRPSSVFKGKNRKRGCGKKCPGARAVWSV